MNPAAEFDIVVYGASGYTGRLVAEYLLETYGAAGPVKWAMAGRNAQKLAGVRDEIGAPAGTTLLLADAADAASLRAMALRTKAVVTTAGPYQLYGSTLVSVCAETGTDYLDLCGEPAWMRAMIDAHEATAKRTGSRILFSCGFDSIPFELGVWFLQQNAKSQLGNTVPRAKCRVRGLKGTFSGGSIASLKATMAVAARDRSVLALLMNPFSLTPGFSGPPQPSGSTVIYDDELKAWTAPFMMAAINTRNVHRSNLLMGHPYGKDFVYDEMVLSGPGEEGKSAAKAVVAANAAMSARSDRKPGEGPGKQERDAGFYDLLFIGTATDGRQIRVAVTGDKDPGYGSTSKIVTETALCLLQDGTQVTGGIWTPGAALQGHLVDKLPRAGVRFTVT